MNPNDWAIVVGISRYPGFADPPYKLKALNGPDNDADAICEWLTDDNGGGLQKTHVQCTWSRDFPDPFPNQAAWGPQEQAIRNLFANLKRQPQTFEGRYIGRRLY